MKAVAFAFAAICAALTPASAQFNATDAWSDDATSIQPNGSGGASPPPAAHLRMARLCLALAAVVALALIALLAV